MRQELVNQFLDEGYVLSPDLDESIDKSSILNLIKNKIEAKEDMLFINKDMLLILKKNNGSLAINWPEFERLRAIMEKKGDGKLYSSFLNGFIGKDEEENKDKNIFTESYIVESRKREVVDFVMYFKSRYNTLKDILQKRRELQNVLSIRRLQDKKGREQVALIGFVENKKITKNGNVMLTIEDITGSITVLVSKDKRTLFDMTRSMVLDEVVGIRGTMGDNILFANDIFFPDVPFDKEFKKCKDEAYATFISDLHVGSNMFLEKEFNKFINWLNGEGDCNYKEVAEKIKYVFIVGDLIDGCGVYPDQDQELHIKDAREQYKKVAEFLSRIRKDIIIIVCPGNHDALRVAEPQPKPDMKYAKELYEMPNVFLLSNPGFVNIHSSETFPGFDILLYHGYSFDYFVSNVDYIRENGGYDRADLILKFLLQKRHLAPSHTSTLYLPETEYDPLIIKKIPDFFITGHIHKSSVSSYRNISLICCSCWQSKTSFQEKVGHDPEPARVPVANLKTREVKILRFDE